MEAEAFESRWERHEERLRDWHFHEEGRRLLVARLELAGFDRWSFPQPQPRSPVHLRSAPSTLSRDELIRDELEAIYELEHGLSGSINNLTHWNSS